MAPFGSTEVLYSQKDSSITVQSLYTPTHVQESLKKRVNRLHSGEESESGSLMHGHGRL